MYGKRLQIEQQLDVLLQVSCRVLSEVSAQFKLHDFVIMPDHVHILCEVDPQYGIATFVRLVKGRSSRLLRQEFPKLKSRLPTLWTNSVFCSTVGGAPLSIIKQYIENQKNR